MSDFMVGLLDLVFFIFDKYDNVICFTPFVVLMFCFTFGLIRKLMRIV